MITVKVKICGITTLEDAQAAVDMGADILGFNFYPKSPRYVEPNKAEEIISNLPGFVDTAGVFVNANGQDIRLGGGVSTIRQYLQAGLIDELHIAISPILLGTGEHLFANLDTAALGYHCTEHVTTAKAMHCILTKRS